MDSESESTSESLLAGQDSSQQSDQSSTDAGLGYEDCAGFELEEVKQRERACGYRRKLTREVPSRYARLQEIVWAFSSDERSSLLARAWSLFNFLVVILAVVVFIVQSWPTYFRSSQVHDTKWFLIDTFIVAVFTTDYILRLMSAPRPFYWMRQPMSIIDLITILPYFVGLILYVSSGQSRAAGWIVILRILRLLRVLRILRVGRFLGDVQAVGRAARRSIWPLVTLVVMLGAGLFFFSTLIFYAEQLEADFDREQDLWFYDERSSDPGKRSPFQSIIHSLWWCLVTMTTVGYGDTFPITPVGKTVAAFTMLIGILILAFPVGVLSVKFGEALVEEISQKEEARFLRPRTSYTAEKKLQTLGKMLQDFETELEGVRQSTQAIAASQAAMAKHIDQFLYQFE